MTEPKDLMTPEEIDNIDEPKLVRGTDPEALAEYAQNVARFVKAKLIRLGWKSAEEVQQIRKQATLGANDAGVQAVKSAIDETKRQTLKEVGAWLDTNVMRTDNRVTKLWVLGDLVRALRSGKMPKEEVVHD